MTHASKVRIGEFSLIKDYMLAYVGMSCGKVKTLSSVIIWGITNKDTPYRMRLKLVFSVWREVRKTLRPKTSQKTIIWRF